jgi:hypothetical protein
MGKHGFFDRPTKAASLMLEADIRALAKARRERERERIARLSDRDIQLIMARKITEAAAQRGEVQRRDFHQAGIPDARIDANFDPAMALARRRDTALDAMGAAA